MASGGARSGAGRKAKAAKFEPEIAAAERRIADKLPKLLANMLKLANGGYEQVEYELQPAGLVMTGSGLAEVKLYPDKDDDELVVVKRKVSKAAPDRAANQYLIDRILGKPAQRLEVDPDPDGALEMTADALDAAAQELAAWREQMRTQLNMPSAPPMPPTPATPSG